MTVYVNGREASSKSSSNKSVAAMPDVCMSPPAPPAGPVPVPYPNTSMASDTTDGSKTTQIGGEEIGLKNASSYKKSSGDEPATNNFGANVTSHKIQGATHFTAYSMDVQIEGANVPRLMDMTAHNDNGGAATVSTGLAGPPGPPKESCEELKEMNSKVRAGMAKSPDPAVQDLAAGSAGNWAHPNAIASAFVSTSTATLFGASSRSILENAGKGNGGAKGLKRPGASNNVCPDNPFQFKGRHQFHAEAKILENVMGAGPGRPTVRFAIDWLTNKAGGATVQSQPCEACSKLIQHACACMKVELCGPDPEQPAEPQCKQDRQASSP